MNVPLNKTTAFRRVVCPRIALMKARQTTPSNRAVARHLSRENGSTSRLQDFTDSYQLPKNSSIAKKTLVSTIHQILLSTQTNPTTTDRNSPQKEQHGIFISFREAGVQLLTVCMFVMFVFLQILDVLVKPGHIMFVFIHRMIRSTKHRFVFDSHPLHPQELTQLNGRMAVRAAECTCL